MDPEEFVGEGWQSVMAGNLPPSGVTVEFMRDPAVYRQLPWFGQWNALPPEFNVAGLWWRYVVDFA